MTSLPDSYDHVGAQDREQGKLVITTDSGTHGDRTRPPPPAETTT
jgi:hypothetical protein